MKAVGLLRHSKRTGQCSGVAMIVTRSELYLVGFSIT